MKKLHLFLLSSFILFTDYSYAQPYKIKEYDDKGPIRITFKMTPKGETEPQKFALVSLNPADYDKLISIRRSKDVYQSYADHSRPKKKAVRSTFTNTLQSRVQQEVSLFPFVLKKVTKVPNVSEKLYETIGWFNIGNGFTTNDRMYGYYMDSGYHHKSIGSAAVNVCTDFVMKFHEKASGVLTLSPPKGEQKEIEIKKTRFNGVLCATCDPDNVGSSKVLKKSGLRSLSSSQVNQRGFAQDVKSKIKVATTQESEEKEEEVEITKKYLELSVNEFQKNKAEGMYK